MKLLSGTFFHDVVDVDISLNDENNSAAVGCPVSKITITCKYGESELEHVITLFSDEELKDG